MTKPTKEIAVKYQKFEVPAVVQEKLKRELAALLAEVLRGER